MNPQKIYLASKSPRRKQLLEDAGFDVTIVSADVEESYPDTLKENEIAEFLANKKAAPFLNTIPGDAILITADSIVVLDDIVYGKPSSKEDAIHTLQKLSGQVHKVYTGICLHSRLKTKSFTALSEIKFAELSDIEINYYLDKFQPYDKAGSYGIQDWVGLCKVEWIKGTMSNIMGLPIAMVYEEVKDMI
jgi:septum formation protein